MHRQRGQRVQHRPRQQREDRNQKQNNNNVCHDYQINSCKNPDCRYTHPMKRCPLFPQKKCMKGVECELSHNFESFKLGDLPEYREFMKTLEKQPQVSITNPIAKPIQWSQMVGKSAENTQEKAESEQKELLKEQENAVQLYEENRKKRESLIYAFKTDLPQILLKMPIDLLSIIIEYSFELSNRLRDLLPKLPCMTPCEQCFKHNQELKYTFQSVTTLKCNGFLVSNNQPENMLVSLKHIPPDFSGIFAEDWDSCDVYDMYAPPKRHHCRKCNIYYDGTDVTNVVRNYIQLTESQGIDIVAMKIIWNDFVRMLYTIWLK